LGYFGEINLDKKYINVQFLPYYSFKGCGKFLNEVRVILHCGQSLWAVAHSALENSALWPIAHNTVLCRGP
jgi:hypothetical protein